MAKKTYRKKVAKKPRVKSRKLRKRTKIRGGNNHQVTGISAYTPVSNVVTQPNRSATTNSTVALYEVPQSEPLYGEVGPKQEDHPNYQSELLKKMDEKLDKIFSKLSMLDTLVEAAVFDKNNDNLLFSANDNVVLEANKYKNGKYWGDEASKKFEAKDLSFYMLQFKKEPNCILIFFSDDKVIKVKKDLVKNEYVYEFFNQAVDNFGNPNTFKGNFNALIQHLNKISFKKKNLDGLTAASANNAEA